jgi:hypothetical protein
VFVTALTEIAPDSGSPGYVTAAVVVSAVLVLLYLVIVAFRVRDSARRLSELESRLDGAAGRVDGAAPAGEQPVGDAASVAAAAEAMGAKR